ncbi:MAG: hypothetical protein J7J61_03620 [Candidatus Hydrothermae bacterium]|nr:hypothetical protein [Candidatus Hydrothermae bacterium]
MDTLEHLDKTDRKVISSILEKFDSQEVVKWTDFEPVERAFLKAHGVQGEVVTIDKVKMAIMRSVSNVGEGTLRKKSGKKFFQAFPERKKRKKIQNLFLSKRKMGKERKSKRKRKEKILKYTYPLLEKLLISINHMMHYLYLHSI